MQVRTLRGRECPTESLMTGETLSRAGLITKTNGKITLKEIQG
jgi:hypothetical protein